MTDSDNNKAVINAFQQAMARKLGGAEVDLGAWLCDDVVWHFQRSLSAAGTASEYRGKEAVLGLFGGDVGRFYDPSSIRFTYHHITAEEDRVHLHFTLRARTSNGRDYENDYQSLFRLRDGRIAEVWEYLDTAYLFSVFSE